MRADVKSLNYIDTKKTRISGATLRANQRDYPDDGIVFLIVDADGCMWIQGHISQSTPREKRLAAQYGDKKRITRGDVITIAKKKSGEEPMRDRMKQPLKRKKP